MAEYLSTGLHALQSTQTASEVRRFAACDIEPLIDFLAVRILDTHLPYCPLSRKTAETEDVPKPWRVLVGIAGIPGSGKSTLAPRLQAGLNAVSKRQFCQCLLPVQAETKLRTNLRESNQENTIGCPIAVGLVGMDGFHLTRAELDKSVFPTLREPERDPLLGLQRVLNCKRFGGPRFPDPKEAHRRRGAPWTFDLRAFWETLRELKMKAGPVVFPTFDHAAKVGLGIQCKKHCRTGTDPDSRGCVVETSTRVVLVEGLYILATEECSLQPGIFDATIFIDTPKTVAAGRVIKRHVASGISRSLEEAKQRWDENDSQNADYILRQLKFAQPDAIIQGDA